MENSKLVKLLITFEAKQWREFRDFLLSPYYNKKEEMIILYDFLAEWGRAGFGEKLSKHRLHHMVYPGEPYKDRQLNYLLSDLFQLAEKFIAIQSLESDSLDMQIRALAYYVDHGLEKHYKYTYNTIHRELAKQPAIEPQYFQYQYQLAELADQHFTNLKKRAYDPNLQLASDALDNFFIIKKLRNLCAMLDRQQTLTEDYDPKMSAELKRYLEKFDHQHIPVIKAYHLFLSVLESKGTNAGQLFKNFKQTILSRGVKINETDLRDLYLCGINHCLRMIRNGMKSYAEDLMEFYEKGMENSVLLQDGKISPFTFKNIVKLGLGLDRVTWTRDFIVAYAEKLPEQYQNDVLNYSQAEVFYHQKAFSQALHYLNQTNFKDIYYSLHAKVMLIKIYVETGEDNALDSLLSSFSVFLQRKKDLTKSVKLPYQNFIKIVSLLRKYKGIGKLQPVRQALEKVKVVSDRSWLVKQIG